MSNLDQGAPDFRKRSAWRLLAISCFAVAAGAAAEEPSRLSLRMSDELTLTTAAARPEAASPRAAAPMAGARDYRIGPDDLLEIQVFGVEQLTRTVRVN